MQFDLSSYCDSCDSQKAVLQNYSYKDPDLFTP